ncbi:MAG: tyrosine-type recombinase/integrase [Anaerolineae bacterium]|nr:tyrosine-type recombinase/integrase [Anaerolineae bacterium]
MESIQWNRYQQVASIDWAGSWLTMQYNLGLASATIDAYGRALQDYLTYCVNQNIEPKTAKREDITRYVNYLMTQPRLTRSQDERVEPSVGLSNATIQQRLSAVRLVYDYLIEEGQRQTNPVGRGRYTPSRGFGQKRAGLVPRLHKLPWIPSEREWQSILQAAHQEGIRNRMMLALAYDAGLRREELCLLQTDDLDPAYRTVCIRAETTKGKRDRLVVYSATTGRLFQAYLIRRQSLNRARGALFLSESPRNRGQPITRWTWSKVVRGIALRAGVPQFSTHTLRHLCLTDLARSGWDLHTIATFAGHRNLSTTMQYIHLSGRDLAEKMGQSMAQIHTWRIEMLASDELHGGAA